MFSAFTVTPTITINLAGESTRPKKAVRIPGSDPVELPIYSGGEVVSGTVDISVPSGKKMDHLGIKVEMFGQIDLYFDRGNTVKFTTIMRELEQPGSLTGSKTYSFDFASEKPWETYSGINVRLRYFVRVTISRNYNNHAVKESDIVVQNPLLNETQIELAAAPIKMEVGIEDCLHIEFEYDRQKYHMADLILGKISFLLVRIKIKHMELAVIRREASGLQSNQYNESENVTKFELMDGAPVKGECVPIRLFLGPLDLTPTYRSIQNVFSVKYYLNLVLIDEEDRRYFKQQEVTFWRRAQDPSLPTATSSSFARMA